MNEPTHTKGHTLELILLSGLSPNNFKCMDICVSDHKAILFNVALSVLNADQETAVRHRVFKPLSALKFSEHFNSASLPALTNILAQRSWSPILTKLVNLSWRKLLLLN